MSLRLQYNNKPVHFKVQSAGILYSLIVLSVSPKAGISVNRAHLSPKKTVKRAALLHWVTFIYCLF